MTYNHPKSQIPNLDSIYQKYFTKFFGIPYQGFFVEVGAYDGESWSNTSGLADSGWSGLYIEPVFEYYNKCLQRHKNNSVKVINCAIGSIEGQVDCYVGDYLTTLDKEYVKIYSELDWSKHIKFNKQKTNKIRLDTLLKKYKINPNFDLLVVDVEGSEEDVFSSFDIQYWKPKMIIVELCDVHFSFEKYDHASSSHKQLRETILSNSYEQIFVDHINTIFIHKKA